MYFQIFTHRTIISEVAIYSGLGEVVLGRVVSPLYWCVIVTKVGMEDMGHFGHFLFDYCT